MRIKDIAAYAFGGVIGLLLFDFLPLPETKIPDLSSASLEDKKAILESINSEVYKSMSSVPGWNDKFQLIGKSVNPVTRETAIVIRMREYTSAKTLTYDQLRNTDKLFGPMICSAYGHPTLSGQNIRMSFTLQHASGSTVHKVRLSEGGCRDMLSDA